jgi:biopolymer transport protein ExbD
MRFQQRRQLKRTRIEIIPMIDTMFFLLVFFMLSSLALVRENSIHVNLPRAVTAKKQTDVDLTVTIDKARQVYVNKDPVTLDDLGMKLVQLAGGPRADLSTTAIVINADLTVPHGLVVSCIDHAREVGITHFAIATAPDTSQPGSSGGAQ